MDAIFEDLYVDGLCWRSWDSEFHYELVVLPVGIRYGIGRNLHPHYLHLGTSSLMLCAKHMPKSPNRQKRPADVISNAVHVMRIATREAEEELTEHGKNAAAVALGRRGGAARARNMTKAKRVAVARKAATARWKKQASFFWFGW